MIDYEPNNQDIRLFTPAAVNVLQGVDHDLQLSPRKQWLLTVVLRTVCLKSYLIYNLGRTTEQLNEDNCSDTTSDSESENLNNTTECSSATSNRLELNITES